MKLGLRGRLTLWGLVASVLPLLALGAAMSLLAGREMRRQLDAALGFRAENFAGLAQSSVFDSLSRNSPLQGWLENGDFTGRIDPARCAPALEAIVKRSRIFLGVALLDGRGQVQCASLPALASSPPAAGLPWFKGALDGTLTSAGVVTFPGVGARALVLALGGIGRDGAARVLVAYYRWDTVAQLIDEAVTQARLGSYLGHPLELQIAAGNELVYDSDKTAQDQAAAPAVDARAGVKDEGSAVVAWARNDIAPTDPGGNLTYLCRLPSAVAYAPVATLLRALAIALIAAAGFSSLGSWLVARRVVQPVERLSGVVERIVREGDLTQEIEVSGNDELGKLAGAFREMVSKLREVPLKLGESVQLLGDAMTRLNDSANQQRDSVTRQAAALQQTQVTAQEIRQTSALAAQKAQAVLQEVERAESVGQAGEAAADKGAEELSRISQHVEVLSGKMTQLGESTRRIAGITETVKDLADQSNMLALNAAIEAVRSGEHGRGFAVVAREIRSLADQSIQATHQVRENLDNIRAEVQQAVAVAEQGSQGVIAGLERVRGSGASLRELSAITRRNTEAVRQIAAAVSQQNAGVDQVFSAVRELSEQMDEIVKMLDSTAQAVEALNDVSGRIARIVGGFRV